MQVRGFALGIEYATQGSNTVAGRPIRIVLKDAEGKPEVGVEVAKHLIEVEGAEVLQCCVSSAVALAVQGVAKDLQRPLLVEPAANPDITGKHFNRYTFRTSRTTDQDALAIVAYLVKNVGISFVQLAPDDAYGRGSAAMWRRFVEEAGGKFVVDDLFVSPETTDFSALLQRVQDAKARVFIVTWSGPGFTPLLQSIQDRGLTAQMTVMTGFGDHAAIRAAYGGVVDLVGPLVYHYAFPKNPINDWLVQQHQRRYASPPDVHTAGGMAAGIALVEALKKTGGVTDADKLIAALEGLTFDTPKGKMTLRAEDHVALQSMYIVRLKNTTDPQLRFFELLEERTPELTAPPIHTPKPKE
jgi:branched-chain amino acid transport system substrate-binding protein